jgi:hypothetical protein
MACCFWNPEIDSADFSTRDMVRAYQSRLEVEAATGATAPRARGETLQQGASSRSCRDWTLNVQAIEYGDFSMPCAGRAAIWVGGAVPVIPEAATTVEVNVVWQA